MSDATENRATPAVVPLEQIEVTGLNPRTTFDDEKLEALAASIEKDGLLQPILLRELASDNGYELVSGERRYRAVKLLGQGSIRAEVRKMSAEKAAELRLVENAQREDLHPLEEAEAFTRLLDRGTYTVEQVAELVGHSVSYVYQRMRLTSLVEEVREAFLEGRISGGHATVLAKLGPDDQRRALYAIHYQPRTFGTDNAFERRDGPLSVAGLQKWVRSKIYLDLHEAPFDAEDAELYPKAGPCTTCPKRSGCNPSLFPELDEDAICTDGTCFEEKVSRHVDEVIAELEAGDRPWAKITHRYNPPYGESKKADVVYSSSWLEVEEADACEFVEVGVFVAGLHRGETKMICREQTCPVHRQGGEKNRTESRSTQIRRARSRRESTFRERLADALRDTRPAYPPSARVLTMVCGRMVAEFSKRGQEQALERNGLDTSGLSNGTERTAALVEHYEGLKASELVYELWDLMADQHATGNDRRFNGSVGRDTMVEIADVDEEALWRELCLGDDEWIPDDYAYHHGTGFLQRTGEDAELTSKAHILREDGARSVCGSVDASSDGWATQPRPPASYYVGLCSQCVEIADGSRPAGETHDDNDQEDDDE